MMHFKRGSTEGIFTESTDEKLLTHHRGHLQLTRDHILYRTYHIESAGIN
jgi:hypothetical protein